MTAHIEKHKTNTFDELKLFIMKVEHWKYFF